MSPCDAMRVVASRLLAGTPHYMSLDHRAEKLVVVRAAVWHTTAPRAGSPLLVGRHTIAPHAYCAIRWHWYIGTHRHGGVVPRDGGRTMCVRAARVLLCVCGLVFRAHAGEVVPSLRRVQRAPARGRAWVAIAAAHCCVFAHTMSVAPHMSTHMYVLK